MVKKAKKEQRLKKGTKLEATKNLSVRKAGSGTTAGGGVYLRYTF
jgi:hypothetical protein